VSLDDLRRDLDAEIAAKAQEDEMPRGEYRARKVGLSIPAILGMLRDADRLPGDAELIRAEVKGDRIFLVVASAAYLECRRGAEPEGTIGPVPGGWEKGAMPGGDSQQAIDTARGFAHPDDDDEGP
jgi:hypothetical protein